MTRIFLALLFALFAFEARAQTATPNCSFTTAGVITCQGPITLPPTPIPPTPIPPTGCPKTYVFKDGSTTDGCASAPTGAPQLASLLTAYGNNRPLWNVAGVDYYTGVPSGLTLKDPSVSPPTGCSYAAGAAPTLNCSGSGVVVQGYDFSLKGGIKLYITGSNNTVTMNRFVMAPNCADPLIYLSIDAGATLTISQNTMDNSGAACIGKPNAKFGSLIFSNRFNDSSTLVLEYNHFLNTFQHTMELYGAPNVAAKVIVRYNAFNIIGFGGHPDGIQFNGGKFDKSLIAFNLFYHTLAVRRAITSQPLHVESQLTAALSNTTVAYNTVVSPGTCNRGNYPVGCSANIDIACKLDAPVPPNVNSGFKAYGNRIDWSGALMALQNNGCTTSTWGATTGFEDNFDLKTGTALTTKP
jgi:hypothetical protein